MYVGIPLSEIKKDNAPIAIENATGTLIQSRKKYYYWKKGHFLNFCNDRIIKLKKIGLQVSLHN